MSKTDTYRVIIGGGGTGGHIYPAISIANALCELRPDTEILFVGAKGKIEMEKVPEAGYEIRGLPVAGFQRRITLKNISVILKLVKSMRMARQIIRTFNPDIAVGVGGYASGPILRAASGRRVPTLIQEQNSYAGVTNRLLAAKANRICVAYEGMEKYFPSEKIILTGNPIRQDLILPVKEKAASMAHFSLDKQKPVILLIGGSLGALTLNESIQMHIDTIKNSNVQLIWQTGRYYYEDALTAWKKSGAENIRLMPFISEMNRAFQVADLIISRAGAGTISELCMVGKPVILVPSPNVAEDHQTSNARALTAQDAAIHVQDKEAREKLVDLALELLGDESRKKQLSKNIQSLAIPDSAARIAKEVMKIIEQS